MKIVSRDLQANLSLEEKPNHGIADDMPRVLPYRRLPHLKRVIRRKELRQLVPLSDTTIYEMEQRDEFPRRFYLTPRCAAWDLGEVLGWIERRRRASAAHAIKPASPPDVGRRKSRPVRR
jgi:prophage regulatory protein